MIIFTFFRSQITDTLRKFLWYDQVQENLNLSMLYSILKKKAKRINFSANFLNCQTVRQRKNFYIRYATCASRM